MAEDGKPPGQQAAQAGFAATMAAGPAAEAAISEPQSPTRHCARPRPIIEAEEGATNRLVGFAGAFRHRHRGRDVAVPSLHRDRRRAAAVLRIPDRRRRSRCATPTSPSCWCCASCCFRSRAATGIRSTGGTLLLPRPRSDPDLCADRRRGFHRPRHGSGPDRRHPRRAVHRHPPGSDAPHHRLDRAGGLARLHRLCHVRALSAAAMDPSRLRHRPAGRPSVHHARGHFRNSRSTSRRP